MISLKQINYALAAERTLHFKKAAEYCSVSQSALSTALSELEKSLGFQIFERNNKQVLVTPPGRQFLSKAREVKLLMDEIEKLGSAVQGELSATLSVGIIPTICPYLLPIVLPRLQREYPALELKISEEQTHVLLEQVRSGDLDTAIIALPYHCGNLLTFSFWEEKFLWITQKQDTRAKRSSISSDEIDPGQLMLLQDGHCLKEHALSACQLSEKSVQHLGATGLNTLVQLVASGMGTTFAPKMAMSQLVLSNPALACVPLSEPGPHREIAFAVRPNYPGVRNIQLLMELFASELARHQ
ncbi:MAG: LysR substrate-binding domain-containing protein [Pseudomonadota bacterium]